MIRLTSLTTSNEEIGRHQKKVSSLKDSYL